MARVQVGGNGHWQVSMPGQKAGGPFTLTVTDSTHYKRVNGIIIGRADEKQAPELKVAVTANTENEDEKVKSENTRAPEPKEAQLEQLVSQPKKTPESKPTLAANAEKENSAGKRGPESKEAELDQLLNKVRPTPELTTAKRSTESAQQPIELIQQRVSDTKQLQSKPHGEPIKKAFLQPQFDDSAWPLVNLNALESLPKSSPLIARKHVHFAIDPQEVSLSVGQANQIRQIYINGQALNSDEWQRNPLKIKVPNALLRSGDNVIALVSHQEWDNTRFIGKAGRFNLNIDQFNLELSNNWSVFHAGLESL